MLTVADKITILKGRIISRFLANKDLGFNFALQHLRAESKVYSDFIQWKTAYRGIQSESHLNLLSDQEKETRLSKLKHNLFGIIDRITDKDLKDRSVLSKINSIEESLQVIEELINAKYTLEQKVLQLSAEMSNRNSLVKEKTKKLEKLTLVIDQLKSELNKYKSLTDESATAQNNLRLEQEVVRLNERVKYYQTWHRREITSKYEKDIEKLNEVLSNEKQRVDSFFTDIRIWVEPFSSNPCRRCKGTGFRGLELRVEFLKSHFRFGARCRRCNGTGSASYSTIKERRERYNQDI